MEIEEINEIIGLVLSEEATPEQMQLFQTWLAHSEVNRDVFRILEMQWKLDHPVYTVINSEELKHKIWNKGMVSTNYSFRHHKSLSNTLNHQFYIKVAVVITILLSAFIYISYRESDDSIHTQSPVWVDKINPPGQKSKIMLPDGSIAWLNAGSKLRFPEEFGEDSRTINLEGEAYFTVSQDSTRPFQVICKEITVTALGTEFNVDGYGKNAHVSLVSGVVRLDPIDPEFIKIRPLFLNPGTTAFLNDESKQFVIDQFDLEKIIGWKDGIIQFDQESFDNIIIELERWYNVDFEIKNTVKIEKKYTGKFRDENLRNVLESLSFVLGFDFELNDKTVIVQ